MKILALEFSSPQRSAAVLDPNRRDELHESHDFGSLDSQSKQKDFGTRATRPSEVINEVVEAGARNTNALGMIKEALAGAKLERAQVECIAIGIGPGSYTGMRAAIAVAQGWQLARPVKLLGISSAEAIAAQACEEGLRGLVHVVIDAQRGEFYLATYDLGAEAPREMAPLKIVSLAELQQHGQAGEILVGPEVTRWFSEAKIIHPRATALARLAWGRTDFLPGEKLEPIYLRQTAFVKAPPLRIVPG
jgi:tRNA threonylcarbamoyl adenosine modification protein YeaZ